MCKETIETAAHKKGEAKAEWDKDTKIVSLTFDSAKTNADAILKRIAYSGYDNLKFLAPDDVYAKLPDCCQYDGPNKETVPNRFCRKNNLHLPHAPRSAKRQRRQLP